MFPLNCVNRSASFLYLRKTLLRFILKVQHTSGLLEVHAWVSWPAVVSVAGWIDAFLRRNSCILKWADRIVAVMHSWIPDLTFLRTVEIQVTGISREEGQMGAVPWKLPFDTYLIWQNSALYSTFSSCGDLVPHYLRCLYLNLRVRRKADGEGRVEVLFLNSDTSEHWVGLVWWTQEMNFPPSGWRRKRGLLRWRGVHWQWRWGEWRSWWKFSQSADESSPSRECCGMFSLPTLIEIPGDWDGEWWSSNPHPAWTHAVSALAAIFVWHLR